MACMGSTSYFSVTGSSIGYYNIRWFAVLLFYFYRLPLPKL